MMKVVAYARYSSDNQRQESIEAQLHAINEYCERNNYELIKVYQDEAMSGTNDDRDGFSRMIDESSVLQYDYVIVHKLDRFARNRYDSVINKKTLENNGKRVVSVLENLDDSPESIMLESVLDGMAEYYSENLAREVRKGLDLNARKGIHNGGKPAYGYDVHNGRLVPNELEANIVNEIFKLSADGVGLRTIADKINNRGIKNKFGRSFNHTSIYYMLRNKCYIGTYEYQPQPKGKKRNNYYKDDKRIVIEDNHKAIVPKELWKQVQIKVGEVKPRMANKQRTYYLTGKVKCGICGNSFHGGGNEGKRFVYTCAHRQKGCSNRKVNADKLEDYIVNRIMDEYLSDDNIKRLSEDAIEIIEESKNNSKKEIDSLTNKLNDIDNKINKLFDTFLDGSIDKDIVETQTDRLQKEKETITNHLEKVKVSNHDINLEEVQDYLIKLKNAAFNKEPKIILQLVDTFVESIIINKDDIEITIFTLTEVVGGSVQSFSPAPINQNSQPSV